jgi:hypothetical protein
MRQLEGPPNVQDAWPHNLTTMKVQPKPSCTAPIKGKTVGRKHTDASSENTSGAEPFGDADSIDIILPNAQDSRVVRLLRSASLGELLVDEFAKPISVSFAVL